MKDRVLVTGASMGIGAEIARGFASRGCDLILTARSVDKLELLAAELRGRGCDVAVFAADLGEPDGARKLWDRIVASGLQVDILINNAGFALWGHFKDTSLDAELSMIQVNIAALTDLTKRALVPMLRRGRGRICNIASTAAFQPGPLMAVYYASKAYVLSFTEALANELRGTGVTATVVCPGPTASNFADAAGLGPSKLFRRRLPTAASVAAQVCEATLAGKTTHVCGLWNVCLISANRFVPRWFPPMVTRWMQERA